MQAFIANPVRVTAARIINVADKNIDTGRTDLTLEDGSVFEADDGMTARYTPVPGDFLVVQEDGYTYLNPREVFERKYRPQGARVGFAADREIAAFLRETGDIIVSDGEQVDHAVVVYGTYGGKFFVRSTMTAVEVLGTLDIGKATMMDAILRPLPPEAHNG